MDIPAEEALSVASRAPVDVRTAVVSDVPDVPALVTGALPTGKQDGRAIGVVSPTDLRMPAFPGANRWVDATQGVVSFTVAGLSLGSSLGQAVGVLAWSDSPSAASVWTATPALDPEDLATSAELELSDDAALIPDSADSLRAEWAASVPQVASLLTEGVTVGVTAIERAVLTLAEPILDAGSASHDVLYWVGVSTWFVAVALAGETLRRRFPQFQTSAPSLFGGPPDPLG